MSEHRHFTTRRGFVAATGFGALGLYGTWAAYGASPLPYSSFFADPPPGDTHAKPGHADHGAIAETPETNGHEASAAMTPDLFLERQAAFLKQFRHGDGSVYPGVSALVADGNAPSAADGHASAHDHAALHAADPVQSEGHDTVQEASAGSEPIDVYLSADRFAFEPDALVLARGRRYRFLMLAGDVTHGAAIAFGGGSRIVRLRSGVVANLELSFLEAGAYLLYCTVNCGVGHDLMHARITVG